MTIIEAIAAMGSDASKLDGVLEKAAGWAPTDELKAEVADERGNLGKALDLDNLRNLIAALPGETVEALKLHLHPVDDPANDI